VQSLQTTPQCGFKQTSEQMQQPNPDLRTTCRGAPMQRNTKNSSSTPVSVV
jgi:hypothetical protein